MRRSHVFICLLIVLMVALFSTFKVSAQDGTGYYGLVLDHDQGYAGDTVNVALDINTWVSVNNDRASPSLYKNKVFSLVWDIGGWSGQEVSAPFNAIQDTTHWEEIGVANWDTNGHLTGTASVPERDEVGDHVLYAISKDGIREGSTMDFWWGYFEILSGGTPTTPTGGIPGFPFESIIIGLLLALGLLYVVRRKSTVAFPVPR